MGGIYVSCPGYQHWKPVNTLSHKVLKSVLLFEKSPWGFCSEPHQICCNAFELHHLLQHMVVNHILILIIDEQNSVRQD
jgi:hypothetical protein